MTTTTERAPAQEEPKPTAQEANMPVAQEPTTKRFTLICPFEEGVPEDVCDSINEIEKEMGMRAFFLLQQGHTQRDRIGPDIVRMLRQTVRRLPQKKVALIIESPGGDARSAYLIAMILRRHCGEFFSVVPRYAKSAATLLALGGNAIQMGRFSELGPLDAQVHDPDGERDISALDEVQSLIRLHAAAMEMVDQGMFLLLSRTRKKVDKLLPLNMDFVAKMLQPLYGSIDVVHYTQMSRVIKVAEEYAARLLRGKYQDAKAQSIARHLVSNYPDHGFVIDIDEARTIGLDVIPIDANCVAPLDKILSCVDKRTVVGSLENAETKKERAPNETDI